MYLSILFAYFVKSSWSLFLGHFYVFVSLCCCGIHVSNIILLYMRAHFRHSKFNLELPMRHGISFWALSYLLCIYCASNFPFLWLLWYIFQLEGRGNVPTRQGPLVDSEKSSSLEKEKNSLRNVNAASGFSEDKLRGLAPGGEGWEKKLKRKRSVGTMLNRGNDVDRDVKPLVQHRPNNEARMRSSDGLPIR